MERFIKSHKNKRNEIFAIRHTASCVDATNIDSYILSLDGVEDTLPIYEYINEKEKWYKASIIPIILSSIITALTILAIVYPLKEMDNNYKAISIIIFTSITILIQIIYRYYREDSIILILPTDFQQLN
jgi:hypothetical protein